MNLPTIYKLSSQWTAVSTLTGIPVGEHITIQNQGKSSDFIEVISSPTKPDSSQHSTKIDSFSTVEVNASEELWIRYTRFNGVAGIDSQKLNVAIGTLDSTLSVKKLDVLSRSIINPDSLYPRLMINSLSAAQQYIVDGFGQSWTWIEYAIPNQTSRYATFTVPTGFYLALDNRYLNPERERFFYRVYAVGSFTIDTTGDPISPENLRSDVVFTPSVSNRVTLTGDPDPNDARLVIPAFGAGGTGQRAEGDTASENAFRIYAPNSTYLLQLENDGSNPSDCELSLIYALIPASVFPLAAI